jgi:hypothetical protein
MRTRKVIWLYWYVFILLTGTGCVAVTPVPTGTPAPTETPAAEKSESSLYSPGSIGDYVITKITVNEPDRLVSFSTKYTVVGLEENRYRITEEIVDGAPPEGYQVTSDLWIDLSNIPTAYGDRNIGEIWIEIMMGQEVSVRRLENQTLEIGDSSFETIVVEITPMDPSIRWRLIKYLSYEVPITPFISTRRIAWEIDPSGGQTISNYDSRIIEIGRASK